MAVRGLRECREVCLDRVQRCCEAFPIMLRVDVVDIAFVAVVDHSSRDEPVFEFAVQGNLLSIINDGYGFGGVHVVMIHVKVARTAKS